MPGILPPWGGARLAMRVEGAPMRRKVSPSMDCLASLTLTEMVPPAAAGAPAGGPPGAFAMLLAQAEAAVAIETGAGLPSLTDDTAPEAASAHADPIAMPTAVLATMATVPIMPSGLRAGPAPFEMATAEGATAAIPVIRPATTTADAMPGQPDAPAFPPNAPVASAPADPVEITTDTGDQPATAERSEDTSRTAQDPGPRGPEAGAERSEDIRADPTIALPAEGGTAAVRTPPAPTAPPHDLALPVTPLPRSPQPARAPFEAPAASPATIHAAAPPRHPGTGETAPPQAGLDAAIEDATPVPAIQPTTAAAPPPTVTAVATPAPSAHTTDAPRPDSPASPPVTSAVPMASPTVPGTQAPDPTPVGPPATPARQIAPVLVSVAIAGGTARLSVMLEPAELGRVEISVERQGDAAEVRVLAERPETLALLQRDQRELDRTLTQAGICADGRSLSFSLAEGGAGGRDAEGRGRMARGVPEAGGAGGKSDGHSSIAAPPRRPLSLLDLAV